jgi:hypothetical protein
MLLEGFNLMDHNIELPNISLKHSKNKALQDQIIFQTIFLNQTFLVPN